MTSILPLRRGLCAAALALTTAGTLLPASPASAAPAVDGDLGAFAYGRVNVAGCVVDRPPADEQRTFNAATGRRTASVARNFVASDPTTISARGRVENATSGVADAATGAFDKVVFSADQLVRVNNLDPVDCRFGAIADSQSSAGLHVERRGRVVLEWDRGRAGQIEQIFVSRNGNPIVDRIRPRPHGDLTFRVRPGDYTMFVQFQTRANETDIPVGTTLTKRAHFRVVADFRR
ncbi:hypothetical protein [Nocardioides antri]|uniref:DUF4397 domain-containing protein n=1 Tax=Nocardioides antri TaxID=2607659 RepID=A0A5B1M0C4_9ACTN|nr:hypothetical protein [Nocardioides antri]KAA1425918.1 hypothetical protein F0U47_16380 [Nocardioides antri]